LTDFNLNIPDDIIKAIAREVAAELADQLPQGDHGRDHDDRDAYTQAEAAQRLAMSVDHFQRHVLPDLRFIRSGRLRLIPRAELEAWLDANAARLGTDASH
jgi:excisionase family DNA binding protein